MNQYQQKYEELIYFRKFIQPLKKWNKLNSYAKEANFPPVYVELHHIKPKSLYPSLIHNKDNIVCLTMYEHILAHKYIMFWYKDEYGEHSIQYAKMCDAYDRLVHDKENKLLTPDEIVNLRIESGRARSILLKGKKRSKEVCKNVKIAVNRPEVRAKKSLGQKLLNLDPIYKAKRKALMKEVCNREEVKKINSESHKICMNRPEVKAKVIAAVKSMWSDPIARQKRIESMKLSKLKRDNMHKLMKLMHLLLICNIITNS